MKINKSKNDKYCKVGKCSKEYIYIIITSLSFILKNTLFTLKDLEIVNDNNLIGFETVIRKHGLIKLVIEYLGFIIYGYIFVLIFKKNKKQKKNENSESDNNKSKNDDSENNKTQNKNIDLLYHENEIYNKNPTNLLIACGVFAFQLTARSILLNLDLWMFDLWIFNIIFISIFLKKIFKYKIYKHHIYIFIFNFATNLILFITASSIKISGESDYENVKNRYGNYGYNVLFYLMYVALSCMICFSQVLQKKVMDYEYTSPSKIVFMYGIISTLFSLIALIISTFVNCNDSFKKLCPIHEPDYKNDTIYLDNFLIFFGNLGNKYKENKTEFFLEILLIYPLYAFIGFFKYFCETMIVYLLNPNYVLISDNIFYSTKKIIRLIYNPSEIKTYLRLFGEIIALFAYIFFLEFFEINCCGLNFDTKNSIDERGKKESGHNILTEGDENPNDSIVDNSDSQTDLDNEISNKSNY